MIRRSALPITFIILLITLVGCISTPLSNRQKSTQQSASHLNDIPSLLAKARRSKGESANRLRITAAQLAVNASDTTQAQEILSLVGILISTANKKNLALVQAELSLLLKDGSKALQWLQRDALRADLLTKTDQIKRGQLKARANSLLGNHLASARERIYINALLVGNEVANEVGDEAGSERLNNQEEIFASLMRLPATQLSEQARTAITHDIRGWLSLAALTKRTQEDPDRQLFALQRWQSVWAGHPAALHLPSSLRDLAEIIANQPKSIALFLPLSGNLAVYGQAIRDGIISARLHVGSHIRVHVFDSAKFSVQQLIEQASLAKVQMAIGPLDRNKVDTLLAQPNLPFPILALNRGHDTTSHAQVYQFGLAPEDEMIQVANRLYADGKRRILALYPDSAWGDRNYFAFTEQWKSLGGITIDTARYADQKDYSKLVKSLLDVDQSLTRAKELKRIVGRQVTFTPRRRQDIDAVFLLGNQSQARKINPTLGFYYAEDVPVYATSHIYQSGKSRIDSLDLNGMRFCDIPWKLFSNQAITQLVKSSWPEANSAMAPFYALGVDAFKLHPRLALMTAEARVSGATGVLRLTENNIIQRALMWAQIINGVVVPAPIVVDREIDDI